MQHVFSVPSMTKNERQEAGQCVLLFEKKQHVYAEIQSQQTVINVVEPLGHCVLATDCIYFPNIFRFLCECELMFSLYENTVYSSLVVAAQDCDVLVTLFIILQFLSKPSWLSRCQHTVTL